jgi:hypothetical protein
MWPLVVVTKQDAACELIPDDEEISAPDTMPMVRTPVPTHFRMTASV